jgi:hypothetical protein
MNEAASQRVLTIFLSGTRSFFSIVRVNDWRSVEKETMSPTNAKLSYTLGALFTVVAVVSFIELVFSTYHLFTTRTIKATHIYIFAIYAFTQSGFHFFIFLSFPFLSFSFLFFSFLSFSFS